MDVTGLARKPHPTVGEGGLKCTVEVAVRVGPAVLVGAASAVWIAEVPTGFDRQRDGGRMIPDVSTFLGDDSVQTSFDEFQNMRSRSNNRGTMRSEHVGNR